MTSGISKLNGCSSVPPTGVCKHIDESDDWSDCDEPPFSAPVLDSSCMKVYSRGFLANLHTGLVFGSESTTNSYHNKPDHAEKAFRPNLAEPNTPAPMLLNEYNTELHISECYTSWRRAESADKVDAGAFRSNGCRLPFQSRDSDLESQLELLGISLRVNRVESDAMRKGLSMLRPFSSEIDGYGENGLELDDDSESSNYENSPELVPCEKCSCTFPESFSSMESNFAQTSALKQKKIWVSGAGLNAVAVNMWKAQSTLQLSIKPGDVIDISFTSELREDGWLFGTLVGNGGPRVWKLPRDYEALRQSTGYFPASCVRILKEKARYAANQANLYDPIQHRQPKEEERQPNVINAQLSTMSSSMATTQQKSQISTSEVLLPTSGTALAQAPSTASIQTPAAVQATRATIVTSTAATPDMIQQRARNDVQLDLIDSVADGPLRDDSSFFSGSVASCVAARPELAPFQDVPMWNAPLFATVTAPTKIWALPHLQLTQVKDVQEPSRPIKLLTRFYEQLPRTESRDRGPTDVQRLVSKFSALSDRQNHVHRSADTISAAYSPRLDSDFGTPRTELRGSQSADSRAVITVRPITPPKKVEEESLSHHANTGPVLHSCDLSCNYIAADSSKKCCQTHVSGDDELLAVAVCPVPAEMPQVHDDKCNGLKDEVHRPSFQPMPSKFRQSEYQSSKHFEIEQQGMSSDHDSQSAKPGLNLMPSSMPEKHGSAEASDVDGKSDLFRDVRLDEFASLFSFMAPPATRCYPVGQDSHEHLDDKILEFLPQDALEHCKLSGKPEQEESVPVHNSDQPIIHPAQITNVHHSDLSSSVKSASTLNPDAVPVSAVNSVSGGSLQKAKGGKSILKNIKHFFRL